MVAGTWLLILIAVAVLAHLLTPYDYDIQDLANAKMPPNAAHWMGTDEFGRDLMTRIFYGARTSLTVSSVSIGLSLMAGLTLGATAAYFGGWLDRVVTTAVDLTWSFPEILIATYIEAARSLGASHKHLLFRHLIPNALAPVLVAAMLATGDAIILEATLGFFGLGAQPPTPSWGAMMSSGAAQLFSAPWIILLPGLVLTVTVIAINLFGDALIAALDIRTKLRDA
jgi:ABC-type dipeptide/oligopeptide/nickel transport system permease subunit